MTKILQEKLQPYRNAIDQIDSEILNLLNKRAKNAQHIGNIKGTSAVYNPEREAGILNKLKTCNQGPLSDESIVRLFREIMSECLALERPLTITYLGPEGTYTQQAAIRQFGHAANTLACNSIDEAFRLVETRQADYVVAPVENSTEGSVGRTLDLLISTPLLIHSEVMLKIHHNFLTKASNLNQIKKVCAHPQALAQCHEWLNKNLTSDIERIPMSSNAEGAKIAQKNSEIAAIGSIIAAELYQLNVLANNIENESNNTTRFLVLGHQKTHTTGQDKTSLVLSAPNQSGAIHQVLAPFSNYGISMTKLESRPSKGGLWEYVFFIDIEGHIEDHEIKLVLKKLKKFVPFIKWLGSYPVSPL